MPNEEKDVVLSAAKAAPGDTRMLPLPEGSIRFCLADGTDVMVFRPDGVIEVRGKVITDDVETVSAFREWLAAAKWSR